MNKKLNIKQIAELAGVSTATVSRVLNQDSNVSDETKEKVQHIIDQTGYIPNMLGRQLIEGKTFLIGLISLTVSGDAIPDLLKGVEEVVEKSNYSIVSGTTYGVIEKELALLQTLYQKQVDGILIHTNKLLPEHIELIKKMHIPIVCLFEDATQYNIPSIILEDEKFTYEATQFIINQGHAELGYIGGPIENVSTSLHRKEGFLKALSDNKIGIMESSIKHGDWTIESGYQAMNQLLEGDKPTAIVVANEGMAIGAINAVFNSGLSVPEDISIIAADDTELAKAARPRLTAIHIPYYEMGIKAAQMLLEYINNKRLSINKVSMNYELIERNSTRTIG